MYNFELKVKVRSFYEVTYTTKEQDFDQRDGAYERTVTKTERFVEWSDLRTFCSKLDDNDIKQIVEVTDKTTAFMNERRHQGKD